MAEDIEEEASETQETSEELLEGGLSSLKSTDPTIMGQAKKLLEGLSGTVTALKEKYQRKLNSVSNTTKNDKEVMYYGGELPEVIIKPSWIMSKEANEKQYSKDWYIDNMMPGFSRRMGVDDTNMHPNNVKQYEKFINDKVAEDIFKDRPNFDKEYDADRLKTLKTFSKEELEIIKKSKYAHKIEPSIWQKFEQGLLSTINMGSPIKFKNENLTQEEAKEENTPLNILQPLSVPAKIAQSAYKEDYTFGDALKGKQNNASGLEDFATDPLNLMGIGLWTKLSKLGKFAKIEDAYRAVKGLSKEEAIIKLENLAKEGDAIKSGTLATENSIVKNENLAQNINLKENIADNSFDLKATVGTIKDKTQNISETLASEWKTLPKKLSPEYQKKAQEMLDQANKWQKDWYENPATIERLIELSDELNVKRNWEIDMWNAWKKESRKNLPEHMQKLSKEELDRIYAPIPHKTENEWTEMMKRIANKDYEAQFQTKGSKLEKLVTGKSPLHEGNLGTSGYNLDKTSKEGVRQNFVDKYGSKIESTTVHEGNHGVTDGNKLIPIEMQEDMVKIFGENTKIPKRNLETGDFENYDEYLKNPTEVYARIMELRKYMNKAPGEFVDEQEMISLFFDGGAGKTPVDPHFFDLVQDMEKFRDLFNKLPLVLPAYLSIESIQEKNKEQN